MRSELTPARVRAAWLVRTLGAALAATALSVSAPAYACSCILPQDIETAGRAALARADVAAKLEIGMAPVAAPSRWWCRADGRARLWFRPGRKLEQSRPAGVVRVLKGSVPASIGIRTSPIENIGGRCGMKTDSCQASHLASGPILLRRIASGLYEPLDLCTQAAFTSWLEQRRDRRQARQAR